MNIQYIRIGILFLATTFTLTSCGETSSEKKQQPQEQPEKKPVFEYGFNLDEYNIQKDTIRQGDTFGKLLNQHGVSLNAIHNLVEANKELLDPKNFKVGQPYAKIFSKKMPDSLAYFIYEPALTHYLQVKLGNTIAVQEIQRKVSLVEKQVGGTIQNNLSTDMINAGVGFSAAYAFSQIFDSTIDFFHLQPEDEFRIIYEERFVDDTIYAGMGKIKAGYFKHKGKPFYAFNFETDSVTKKNGFYDENGNMMKKMFLKAPLDIFRITSRFGMRYHPVLHRMKGHFGTDYAAPTGTPIRTTASGVVTQAGYSGGNGNYVRVRHNKTYETQYLHMSQILVKKGQYVAQGDIIGKVGSTGLASGPHVCYRFWKNGVQVDPLKEDLPQSEPIDEKLKEKYMQYITPLKKVLDEIPLIKSEYKEELGTEGDSIPQK